MLNDAGLICLAAFVAPDAEVRSRFAERVGRDRFLLVHLAAPIEVCRERDTDNRYQQADDGEIANFPGVSAPYEPPTDSDLELPTDRLPVDDCVARVIDLLEERGII